MRRWHEDYKIAYREWKKHHSDHVQQNKDRPVGYDKFNRKPGQPACEVECPCDNQVGRFRKIDAFDCGKARCMVCHNHKFWRKEPTRQEEKAKLSFSEQLREFQL